MHIKARSLFGLYRYCLHVALRKREFGSFNGIKMKFDYEYLLRIKANVDVRRSIMRVAYTKTIFCLLDVQTLVGCVGALWALVDGRSLSLKLRTTGGLGVLKWQCIAVVMVLTD